ncbi:hypothetical protein L202_00911 [Cryptococcus amylolentus CBS 6039]|uniref:Uncharacterized protein n=1 Tax=Cryptococcus amylolentus CBS 6039 TaxID=1295533 RepID=A0A1E3I928_9TREE|nr:hypothetical protein L202_00911 [Cryptococcus amylolentus CBS 6039]ODN85084.1 hypothetical protein L202_00911 [Cryptococcus amylolentus CBS 6039]
MSDNITRISTGSVDTITKFVVLDTSLEENRDLKSAVRRITTGNPDFIEGEDVEVTVTRQPGTDYATVTYPGWPAESEE